MKGKKVAAVLMSLCCAVAPAGCGGGNEKDAPSVVKGLPDYSADEAAKQIYIGGYVSPPHAGDWSLGVDYITQESYNDIAACDIDYVLTLYEQGACEENKLALDYAKEAGVKILVRWDDIISYGSATPAMMRKQIGEIIEHEACWGIFAKDEPNAALYSKLGKAREVFAKVTDKYFYVNLLPNYAEDSQLGTSSYRDYVYAYAAMVKNNMINEDHYPLKEKKGVYSVNDGYLSNLEIMQKCAQDYNMEHWEYIPGEKINANSKTPDYYDFRFMFYTEMCYGVENMQYFCYWSPFKDMLDETAAFIAADGTKSPLYYDGQKINKEIHKFDHVYMNFVKNWKGTMTLVGSQNEKGENKAFDQLQYSIVSTPRIESITATQDTLVGTYQDGDGRDGFMITNYTVPGYRLTDSVTVEFKQTDEVIYYKEGEYHKEKVTNGKFTVDLGAGEGVFVIPVKY